MPQIKNITLPYYVGVVLVPSLLILNLIKYRRVVQTQLRNLEPIVLAKLSS